MNSTFYHIWNERENHVNLCLKCEHPLMYDRTDRPKLYSKLTGKEHHTRYYHGDKCIVCGHICGEELYQ